MIKHDTGVNLSFNGRVVESSSLRRGFDVYNPRGWIAIHDHLPGVVVGDVVHTIYHRPTVIQDGGDKFASLVKYTYTQVFAGAGRAISRSGSWRGWVAPATSTSDYCSYCGTDNGPHGESRQGFDCGGCGGN